MEHKHQERTNHSHMQNEIHKYHDEWNEPHTKCMLCTSIHIIVKKKKVTCLRF